MYNLSISVKKSRCGEFETNCKVVGLTINPIYYVMDNEVYFVSVQNLKQYDYISTLLCEDIFIKD